MEEGLSPTKISYEAGKRPKKAKRSGSGNYCCVAELQKHARPRLKQALLFFHFHKPQKEERNGFKVNPDFREEEGKINPMEIMHS